MNVRAALVGALLAALAASSTQGFAAEPRWDIEAWHAHESLSGGRAPWIESGSRLERRDDERRLVGIALRMIERFGQRDREASVQGYTPLGGGWAASGELSASSTHAVLPRDTLALQLERQLGGGWVVQVGYRHADYTTGDAELRTFTLEHYFGDHRVAYTLYSGKPDGAPSAPSHRVQWSYDFDGRGTLGVSLARGREVEYVGGTGLLVSEVRNLTLFARYWFASRWAVSADAVFHRQGILYRRHGFRLGLRHRF